MDSRFAQDMTKVLLVAVLLVCALEGLNAKSTNAKACLFGDDFYDVNDTWHPKLHPSQPEWCVNCTCSELGEVKCRGAKCPKPDCEDPKYVHGKCCPVCHLAEEVTGGDVTESPGCEFHDQRYAHGARFPSNNTSLGPVNDNQCVLCYCRDSKVSCLLKLCQRDPKCVRTSRVTDDCCPVCVDPKPEDWEDTPDGYQDLVNTGDCMTSVGRKENGSKWKPEVAHHGAEPCVLCKCLNGVVNCNRIQCPPVASLKCQSPHRRRGQCCKECHQGKTRRRKNEGKKKDLKDRKNERRKTERKGDSKKKGEKKGARKGGRKKKGGSRKCKKVDDGKERKKKGRRRRCKNNGKGSRRRGRFRKRKGGAKKTTPTGNDVKAETVIPLDAVLSDVIETLCLPKRTEKLVFINKTNDVYSMTLDGVRQNAMEVIQWTFKRGRMVNTKRRMVLDPQAYRSRMSVGDIVGATSKRHLKKFMKRLERKQKRCKKKCRRKILDRLFKKLRTKKLDLNKRCRL